MRGCEFCQSTSSPGTAWCSAYARPSPRHASTWSVRSATGAQRLVSAGTLVRVLEPPVKAGISQGRSAQQYPPLRCGAADYISSIAKPVVSWDHHNLLISTIHEDVQSRFNTLKKYFMHYKSTCSNGLSVRWHHLEIPLRLSQDITRYAAPPPDCTRYKM